MTTPDGKDMNVLSKTPDEIKKGLEYCGKCNGCRGYCPYDSFEDSLEECTSKLAIDALALIQQLEAEVPKWISVEEMHPAPSSDALCVYTYDRLPGYYGIAILTYYAYGDNGYVSGPHFTDEGKDGMRVTHWMPLPEPPKE